LKADLVSDFEGGFYNGVEDGFWFLILKTDFEGGVIMGTL
jgi:hypothetical protein